MPDTVADRARRIVEHLGGRWRGNYGMCHCPAHDDRRPSLSVRVGSKAVLFTCWAKCDREEIARALGKLNLNSGALVENSEPETLRDAEQTRALANWLWLKTIALIDTLADRYLTARGLSHVRSGALRYAPQARFGSGIALETHPAMIAAVKDEHGITAIQRTILDPTTARKIADNRDPRRMLGQPGRGAVRLWPATEKLGLTEGVETAIAASRELGIPVWASLGTKRFPNIQLPPTLTELVLLADDDRAGHAAAEVAAGNYARPGLTITTQWPAKGRIDWNDPVTR